MKALLPGGAGFIGRDLVRRALTGYEPMVPLGERVRRTFDWYRESWPR